MKNFLVVPMSLKRYWDPYTSSLSLLLGYYEINSFFLAHIPAIMYCLSTGPKPMCPSNKK
jgi:hypothetical protein